MSCKLYPWFMPARRHQNHIHGSSLPLGTTSCSPMSYINHNHGPRLTWAFLLLPSFSQQDPHGNPSDEPYTVPVPYTSWLSDESDSLTSPLAAASDPLPDEYPHPAATTQHSPTPALKLLLAAPNPHASLVSLSLDIGWYSARVVEPRPRNKQPRVG